MQQLYDYSNNPDRWKVKHDCNGSNIDQGGKRPCYRKWEVSVNDIVARKVKHSIQRTETVYGFFCPECGCFNALHTSDIPYYVRCHAQVCKDIAYPINLEE